MRTPSIPTGYDCEARRSVTSSLAQDHPGRLRYRCPDPTCLSPLTTHNRNGYKYFKHFPDAENRSCRFWSSQPSVQHSLAVDILRDEFSAALDGRTSCPLLQFSGDLGDLQLSLPYFQVDQLLGDRQWACPRTGRQPDLTLLLRGEPVLLVEVWHKHKVDRPKAQDLHPHRWIEVRARDVLSDSRRLKVVNHGGFPDDLDPYTSQGRLFGRAELDACSASRTSHTLGEECRV